MNHDMRWDDIGELEAPVAPLHPAFGGAVVNGGLKVRTEIRAGSLAARGNIVQCYPAAPGSISTSIDVILTGGG